MGKGISVLTEAKRLWGLGFAVLWLKAGEKKPVGFGWTKGPRKEWGQLEREWQGLDPKFIGRTPGKYNVGVRLGAPSKLSKGYLCVIDIDVKSSLKKHQDEARAAQHEAMQGLVCPYVESGRKNGSGHYYGFSSNPFQGYDLFQSPDFVRARMPSKGLSARDRAELTPAELKEGWRMGRAWEVTVMSDGRQVVLPPSVHPDSKKTYEWVRALDSVDALADFSRFEVKRIGGQEPASGVEIGNAVLGDTVNTVGAVIPELVREANVETSRGVAVKREVSSLPTNYVFKPVELDWAPISDEVYEGITSGTGVSDRSAYLIRACHALVTAGLKTGEILSVLTDPKYFISDCAYEHVQSRDRRKAAEWVYKFTLKKIKAERTAVDVFGKLEGTQTKKLSQTEIALAVQELEQERHWTQDLIKNQQGAIQRSVQNVVHILAHAVSPEIIVRDEFTMRDSYGCNAPWKKPKGALITDDDVAFIKYWLGCNYQIEPQTNTVLDALTVIAHRNSFDPVKDFLTNLEPWDGTPRLDTWLADNFEAKGHPEYLAQVFRKWMYAMVLRVFQPGAKFDWMPIFEGYQGKGKSSFGEILVTENYFLDNLPPNLQDKESAIVLQGMWAVEFGELSHLRRNELEVVKSFITRRIDKVRPPYGRKTMELARRCVFFGTTNKEKYLTDESGNRRFKPVMVGQLHFDSLRRDRIQLFAETKALYLKHSEDVRSLNTLTGEAKIYEDYIHQEKMIDDDSHTMEEMMRDFVDKVKAKRVQFSLHKFQLKDLFGPLGPLTKWGMGKYSDGYAIKMLKRLGADNWKSHGKKYWGISNLTDSTEGVPTVPRVTLTVPVLSD